MKCSLVNCNNSIPKERKRSAKYCSDVCYYEAKKERSLHRYALLKAPSDELKRCEGILAYLYGISQLNKSIHADDLLACNFNYSLSAGEHLDDKKRLFKIIGAYAYYIDQSKNLTIWKLKQKK